jgi:hypothetical protein
VTRYAHIINPFKASTDRDIYFAQPVAFESIKRAKDFSRKNIIVDLLTAQFREDRTIVPGYFQVLDDLDRSFLENQDQEYKLPYIVDILDQAYHNANDAEYIVHSETDIALMPHFYEAVDQFIDQGYDAIIINCRTIPEKYSDKSELPLMWSEVGEKHPGWDCFIFRRDVYKKFSLGDVIVGANSIGRALYVNMKYHAKNFIELTDSHLTFHIGKSDHLENIYKPHKNYFAHKCNAHNEEEVLKIINTLLKDTRPDKAKWLEQWKDDCESRLGRYRKSEEEGKRHKYLGYWRLKNIKNKLGLK